MNLIDNWKTVVFERYAKFDGRARRPECWLFILANVIAYLVLYLLMLVSSIFFIVYVVWALAMLIPNIAVEVRRLHDTDRTGWWLLISLIPFVGFIVLLVFLVTDSTPSDNQYGPYEAAGPA